MTTALEIHKLIHAITREVAARFSTVMEQGKPLQFAAGVDVDDVVIMVAELTLNHIAKKMEETGLVK